MNRIVLRLGSAALCASMLAAIGCGCVASPVSSGSSAQQTEALPYDSSQLNDGKLRIFYETYGSANSSAVLCGGEVLCRASGSETLSLLQNDETGVFEYYIRTWSDTSAQGGRCNTIYDKTGQEVYTVEGNLAFTLYGTRLSMTDASFDSYYSKDMRMVDLSTKQEIALPENAYDCVVCDGTYFFTCYNQPHESIEESDDYYQKIHCVALDAGGSTVGTWDGCCAVEVSSASDKWIRLMDYRYDFYCDILFCPSTGQTLEGDISWCNGSYVCVSTSDDDSYQLLDLSGDSPVLVGDFDCKVTCYAPGVAVLWNKNSSNYLLYDIASGHEQELYAENTDYSNIFTVYGTDDSLKIYDLKTGELLLDTIVEPTEDMVSAWIYSSCSKYALLECCTRTSDDVFVTSLRYYGTDGTVRDLTETTAKYSSTFLLVEDSSGLPYLYGLYTGAGGAVLYDVFDSYGNVLVHALSECCSADIYQALPEGAFIARRGFEQGWMDIDGNWIYCQSIFTMASDE